MYYRDEELLIRDLALEDAEIITRGEVAQGWHATVDKYLMRLKDAAEGKCISLVCEYRGNVAGYINVYTAPEFGPYKGNGLPEIVDFGVLEKYRCRGIGSKLMDAAEEIAAKYADTVYLGVGLHSGYGSAQRMYVKRGYIPDGRGAWYGDKTAEQYENYENDDDFCLYLFKKLR